MRIQQLEWLRNLWGRLSQNQRVGVIAIAMVALVASGLLMLSRPSQEYQTVFSGLASDDAAAIVETIQSQGIPYELGADGSTIRVPPEQVASVRLNAASNGLPKGGSVGFELFDKSSFGITEFAQQVNYQRALEGELQRTINKIDVVAASRVHIVIPEDSLFTDEQEPTTAAVVVQFKPGGKLSKQQIKGVTHLVASSVPGLNPENLTVVDSSGNPIWSGTEGDTLFAGAEDTFSMQKAYELDLSQRLETMINRVAGSDGAIVRVNAVLNWDQRSVESEIYSPDNAAPQIRSQQERTETASGSTAFTEGAPGAENNVQTFQEGAPGADTQEQSSHDITTNYELSRRVESVVEAPGKVERLTVAVMLDGNEVDPMVAQEIQNVVTTAAGIDLARGDMVTVSAVPFKALDLELPGAEASLLDRLLSVAKVLGIILIPIVAILIARRVLLKQGQDLYPAIPEYYPDYSGNPAYSATEVRQPTLQVAAVEPRAVAPAPPVERRPSMAHQQVLDLADADPSQLAALVRLWMNEEK